MKSRGHGRRRGRITGLVVAATVLGLGYLFSSAWPLDQELAYLALIAAFIICDRSFMPRRTR